MSPQSPPLQVFPPSEHILAVIPDDGISFDDLVAKLSRPLSNGDKTELRRLLDPLATFNVSTGIFRKRPRRTLVPGTAGTLISRPRNRRRVVPFSSKWIGYDGNIITRVRGQFSPTWRKHEVRGLVSKTAKQCYRHVTIQLLLNSTPALHNFLHTHKTKTQCHIRDCLTCSLAKLAEEYARENSPANTPLTDTLDSFYSTCNKVFWGPRARAKRRVGPMDPDNEGDIELSFMFWLLYEIHEQLLRYPSDMQEFERLFMLEEQGHTTCLEGHIEKGYLLQRFYLSLEGKADLASNDLPLDHTNLVGIAKTEKLPGQNPACNFCDSDDTYTKHAYYLRKPEILMIVCPLRVDSGTWEAFAYQVRMEEEISLCGTPYVLCAATLVAGEAFAADKRHVVAAVRAPNGQITIVSDKEVREGFGKKWSDVEKLQTDPNPANVLLPHMLVYRRNHDPETPRPTNTRGSIANDANVETAILAMKAAFPHIETYDLLSEYYRHDQSIQATVNFFVSGRDEEKTTTMDNIIPGYLEDVIKAYIKYPQLSVEKIYEVIQGKHGNFDYAMKTLEDFAGRRINYAFVEFVGEAGFNCNLDVVDGTYVDGFAEFSCKKTKKVRTAKLFGRLVGPKNIS